MSSALLNPPADASATLLLSAADLARELRVSIRTLRAWDAAGRIPRPIRLGHAVRWERAELVRWLAAGGPLRVEWEAMRDTD